VRRTFWLAAGFGLGLYAGERVRRTVVKLTPETFGDRVRELVDDAIEAGKTEMHARERTLRETFAAPDRSVRSGRARLRVAGEPPGTGR
jgi:hypothetical protein